MNGGSYGGRNQDEKGLIWKLPVLKSERLGKLGPAFGFGAGCGFGLAFGLFVGAGFGPGTPGLQLGFGVGGGCGIGVGFGYGFGRGIAYDDSRKYNNVGKFSISSIPSELLFTPYCLPDTTGPLIRADISSLVDEIVVNTKKLIKATSKELDKWREP